MLRSLYAAVLRLHPAPFRRRFGDGMVEIFDGAATRTARALLVADALASLGRQWAFRAEFRRPAALAGAVGSAEGPLFWTIEPYQPRPGALFSGGILAVAALCAVAGLIAMGSRTGQFLVGVHHPSAHLLPVARASVAETELNTTIRFGPDLEDPMRPIARAYFRAIRVLGALDADGDLILSPWELATAPAALRRLDTDHDGKLSAEECGFGGGRDARLAPDVRARARLQFMRLNPVLAALDADRDGEISAAEMAGSYAALKTLDRNGDGSLTPDELLPDRAVTQAAVIMVRLDADGDGVISRAEQESDEAEGLRTLLRSADRNGDGAVTAQELQTELRLRAEQNRELERARRAAGFPQ